jgi:hypothetical protein
MNYLHPDIYFHRIIIYSILAFILFSAGTVGINGYLFGVCCGLVSVNLFNLIHSLLD